MAVQTPLTARAAIVQALAFPGYGIEIIERIKVATGGLVRLGMGSIYPALQALEEAGLVRCETVRPSGSAGRPKKYYELTASGVAVASAERAALAGLLRAIRRDPPAGEGPRMGDRLRRTADVSASVARLRDGLRAPRRRT